MKLIDKLTTLDRSKGSDHTDDFWRILRAMAVLDYALRSDHPPPNGMDQFETIMRRVRVLTNVILEEQGVVESPQVN